MPGGLLNIISYGSQNIILNGNPSKTFFKCVYSKYTNFGLQNIRIDFNGQRMLKLNESSTFTFKIPRNAELLLDTYLVFNLPDIWSPIKPPLFVGDVWKPYEFQWIEDIGTNIIENVQLSIGGQLIQQFSGDYIKNSMERDFTESKKKQFYKMTGNTVELNNPSIAYNRFDKYPNSYYKPNLTVSSEPSIRGRKIYVPLPFWFSHSSKLALPLVGIQYSEIQINITLRPICELFVINDVTKTGREFTKDKIKPNFTLQDNAMYRFLIQPTDTSLAPETYIDKPINWDADINLLATFCFLTGDEAKVFALNEQKYLIKDIRETKYLNTTGTQRIKVDSNALVSSWMFYFKRSDVALRNQWSNYSNWLYNNVLPYDVFPAPTTSNITYNQQAIGPAYNYKDTLGNRVGSKIFITPELNPDNLKDILTRLSIIFDGQFRETDLDSGVYNYVTKYKMSMGSSNDGLYSYNFTLNTSDNIQPHGAINLSKFKTIEIELSTIIPPFDTTSITQTVCDSAGNLIGIKDNQKLYSHTFDLFFIEERYNILRVIGGSAGLVYAR
uniref:Major capsid protein N-terminal domain-containing protein n=1 Tax=viral metagenome TaxID=1070528 RepID=A0A6C0D1C4_9ZZZZ